MQKRGMIFVSFDKINLCSKLSVCKKEAEEGILEWDRQSCGGDLDWDLDKGWTHFSVKFKNKQMSVLFFSLKFFL